MVSLPLIKYTILVLLKFYIVYHLRAHYNTRIKQLIRIISLLDCRKNVTRINIKRFNQEEGTKKKPKNKFSQYI